jgi:hypothetical protein
MMMGPLLGCINASDSKSCIILKHFSISNDIYTFMIFSFNFHRALALCLSPIPALRSSKVPAALRSTVQLLSWPDCAISTNKAAAPVRAPAVRTAEKESEKEIEKRKHRRKEEMSRPLRIRRGLEMIGHFILALQGHDNHPMRGDVVQRVIELIVG